MVPSSPGPVAFDMQQAMGEVPLVGSSFCSKLFGNDNLICEGSFCVKLFGSSALQTFVFTEPVRVFRISSVLLQAFRELQCTGLALLTGITICRLRFVKLLGHDDCSGMQIEIAE